MSPDFFAEARLSQSRTSSILAIQKGYLVQLSQWRMRKRNGSNVTRRFGRNPEFNVVSQLTGLKDLFHRLIDEGTGLDLQALLTA